MHDNPDEICDCGARLVTEAEQEGQMCEQCLAEAVARLQREQELWEKKERGEITLREFFDACG